MHGDEVPPHHVPVHVLEGQVKVGQGVEAVLQQGDDGVGRVSLQTRDGVARVVSGVVVAHDFSVSSGFGGLVCTTPGASRPHLGQHRGPHLRGDLIHRRAPCTHRS